MAVRRKQTNSDQQLDFFRTPHRIYDTPDPIRPDGRETLARTPSENGARPGTEGATASDVAGGGGKDEGRNGHVAPGIDEDGKNGATGPHTGLGNGAGEI